MSHEIESAVFMASEGAGWTGLGRAIPLEIAADPAAIAALCNATWTVNTTPVYTKNAGRAVCGRAGASNRLPRGNAMNKQAIRALNRALARPWPLGGLLRGFFAFDDRKTEVRLRWFRDIRSHRSV